MKAKNLVFIVGNLDGNKSEIIDLYQNEFELIFFASQAELLSSKLTPSHIVLDPFSPLFKNQNTILKLLKNQWSQITIQFFTSEKNSYYLKKMALDKNVNFSFYGDIKNTTICKNSIIKGSAIDFVSFQTYPEKLRTNTKVKHYNFMKDLMNHSIALKELNPY